MNGHTLGQVSWGELSIEPELRLLAAVVNRARRDAGQMMRCNRRHALDPKLQAEAQQFLAEVLDTGTPKGEA